MPQLIPVEKTPGDWIPRDPWGCLSVGSWDRRVEYALPEAQGLSIFPMKTPCAASVLLKGLTFIHSVDIELPTLCGGSEGQNKIGPLPS